LYLKSAGVIVGLIFAFCANVVANGKDIKAIQSIFFITSQYFFKRIKSGAEAPDKMLI